MSAPILQSASKVSTFFRCDNCGIRLHNVIWMQCELCKAFDLCHKCAAIPYHKLSTAAIDNHQEVHKNTMMTGDCLKLVTIDEVIKSDMPLREQRKQEKYEHIIKQKQIGNDYDMDNVMNKLVHDSPSTENQLHPLVVNYYLKAN